MEQKSLAQNLFKINSKLRSIWDEIRSSHDTEPSGNPMQTERIQNFKRKIQKYSSFISLSAAKANDLNRGLEQKQRDSKKLKDQEETIRNTKELIIDCYHTLNQALRDTAESISDIV
jgi:uncharacterized phage infection (PIP) family protein YhgE